MGVACRPEVGVNVRQDINRSELHGDYCEFHIDHYVHECTCKRFDANGALKRQAPPAACPRCGGEGFGGSNWGVEFCTCIAGSMAAAFYRADSEAYFSWLRAQHAHEKQEGHNI